MAKKILSIKSKKIIYTYFILITLLKQLRDCLNSLKIGERGKFKTLTIWVSITVNVDAQELFITITFMTPDSFPFTPVNKEYFQPFTDRVYKICRRYFIQQKTLEHFGVLIDQGKVGLPEVVESDRVVSNPENEKSVEVEKPFCCKHCGSENYIKYGKKITNRCTNVQTVIVSLWTICILKGLKAIQK